MSVAADTHRLHHSGVASQSFLQITAERVILDYLQGAPRRQGVTLKTLCYNVLPANRNLLLKSIEALAKRGLIQLRPSAGDILVRLAERESGGGR